MFMLLLDPKNSNQLTTQGGWRYTPCGNKICSRTHRVCGHMSDPSIKWHRENSKNAKFYARLAYMVKTGKHQRTGTEYTDRYRP